MRRRAFGVAFVLFLVGMVALVTFLQAAWPTKLGVVRVGVPQRDLGPDESSVGEVVLHAVLWVLRRVGVSDAWILGVTGAVVVVCAVGIGTMFRWVGRAEEAARMAAEIGKEELRRDVGVSGES